MAGKPLSHVATPMMPVRVGSERMSLRLEYRYTDLGSTNFASGAGGGTTDKSDVDFHAVRAGVSFKF